MNDERSQLLEWFAAEQAYNDLRLSQLSEEQMRADGTLDDREAELLCARLYVLLLRSGNETLATAFAEVEAQLRALSRAIEQTNRRLEAAITRGTRIRLTTNRLKAIKATSDRFYDLQDRRDRVIEDAAAWLAAQGL